ncbi:phosphatase PAP2 family protein [Saccharopolyspora pogona]|uniref:phosphatase PAP2 family protein n=1 Tax=Saccharopolyspora pogona TaxID=333966 RepID=UPI0016896686|nr:phosphatase PAP2 family protein [Saccharopolyspora pogona]
MNGATFPDSDAYVAVTQFAQRTPWLWGPMSVFTTYGVVALVVAVLWMLWWARRGDSAVVAKVLWVGIAVVAAYALDSALKSLVAEQRPCRALPDVVTVLPCDGITDYAFPSNHAVIFAAFALATLIVRRSWGCLAVVGVLLMAFSRIYVGAHYPHDVIAGLLVGGAIGGAGIFARRPLAAGVERLRRNRLRGAV